MTNLAILDDHALFLGGLAFALRERRLDWKITTFEQPQTLLDALASGASIDLIISDLLMQSMNGMTFARRASGEFKLPILLISGVESPPSRAELEGAGVKGFLHKSSRPESLVEAIEMVLAGDAHFPFERGKDAAGASAFGRLLHDTTPEGADPAISGRRLDVLKLVAQGASNKEIARSLGISENTVKTHLRHIFEALAVTKRTACVRAAKLQGLLE